MIGTSWMREQGLKDPLLVEMLRERGMDQVPLWGRKFPERDAAMRRWDDLAPLRDGPVNAVRTEIADVAAAAADIKRRALALGADRVGIAALRSEYIEYGVDLPHDNVIAVICREDYQKVMAGPDAVDLEAMTTYVRCAEVATELARHIREDLGYPALAHHNGSVQIQAIPVMHQVGFGELGKHGSLIHPDLGANFRPGFVTTTLPLAHDAPIAFGVQDYCLSCNLCTNNCPADAIPAEYIMTEGVRRWLTDIEKCYTVSRLRPAYCHICVDVCPYIHKENGDEAHRATYKSYMKGRKADGYKTPKRLDESAER
jgi:formate hydrogenlyase subunit 6/NADH:ubiquinone oxidoreductase subunit I